MKTYIKLEAHDIEFAQFKVLQNVKVYPKGGQDPDERGEYATLVGVTCGTKAVAVLRVHKREVMIETDHLPNYPLLDSRISDPRELGKLLARAKSWVEYTRSETPSKVLDRGWFGWEDMGPARGDVKI